MSLVPVIYSSLIIFGSLLLTVLVISYISYRLKKGTTPKPAMVGNTQNIASASINPNLGQYREQMLRTYYRDGQVRKNKSKIKPVYPKTKSSYQTERIDIENNKKINVIYRENITEPNRKRKSRKNNQRYTILTGNQILSINNELNKKVHSFSFENSATLNQFSENELLKFYDDV
ncbi:hypothetical protein ACFLS9_02300 [Bacteroidota bacterium]